MLGLQKNTEHFFCILFKGEATQFGKLDETRFVRLPFGGASENSRSPLACCKGKPELLRRTSLCGNNRRERFHFLSSSSLFLLYDGSRGS